MLTHSERVAARESDWSRNVRDEFKGMSVEQIKDVLSTRRNNLVIGFDNAIRDFNFSGIIRASNAFCCQGIIYSGFRRYDPRGAVGTKHYENVIHVERSLTEVVVDMRTNGYRIVVAESDEFLNSKNLAYYDWEDKTFLIMGEEAIGVAQDIIDLADDVVYIPQFGSVRSLNVASAAHIFMWEYMKKTGRL